MFFQNSWLGVELISSDLVGAFGFHFSDFWEDFGDNCAYVGLLFREFGDVNAPKSAKRRRTHRGELAALHFCRKIVENGTGREAQNHVKSIKRRCQNAVKFCINFLNDFLCFFCHFGVIFHRFLEVIRSENRTTNPVNFLESFCIEN